MKQLLSVTRLMFLAILVVLASCSRSVHQPSPDVAPMNDLQRPTVSSLLPYDDNEVPTNPEIYFMFNEHMLTSTVEGSISLFEGIYEPSPESPGDPGSPGGPENPCWECTDPIPPPGGVSAASVQSEESNALTSQATTLDLVSVCDGMWQVGNSGSEPVSFSWQMEPSHERSVGVVQAGSEAFFYTSKGDRTVGLSVDNLEVARKSQNTNACDVSFGTYSFSSGHDRLNMTFRPHAPLKANTSYTLVMSTKPQSEADGAHLRRPYVLIFTTGSQTNADLPAPWSAASIGDATGASAYHAGTDSFSLSATGTGSMDAFHYVYQPLVGDGMIVGRVLELTTDHPTASAGLMLRQDNGASSAYALVALTPEGIRFEYREGGEDVIRMAGRTTAAPVWLKLERKEESVHAYESDDGVNWTLIAGITLSLANPYHAGLAISSTTTTQASFQEVQVQGDIRADFSASPASGTVPLSVQFAATPDDPALSYQWDFGDGTAATGAQVSHTFTSPDAYFVRLTVSRGEVSETVGRHVIVQSQKQTDGYYTVNPGDTIVGVDGVTFVTEPSYATGPSRLRIETTEATALPEDVPELILSEFRRVISSYYEVFSPDVDEVANPNRRERLFYIGMPVPEGVDGRRVTIYGAGYGMVLCEPAEGSSCISGEQYSWNDFSSDGFYHPASNMYYTPVPNYPSGRPEYFVMVEMTGRASNRVREVLPWEDSGSTLNLIMPFQIGEPEPVDIDAAESENLIIRCNVAFADNNSTACTDLAEDIVGVAQDAYDYLRRHGFGAPYSRTSADGRHVIDVHPIVADPDGDGRRCADGPAVNGRVNFLRRTHEICLELNHSSITQYSGHI